jgi:hypothetical protein
MDVLDVPVSPNDLGGGQRHTESEVLKDQALEFTCPFALRSTGPDGAEEFAYGDTRAGLVEADQVTSEFVKPYGGFQSKRDGDRGLAVGSAEHDGVALALRNICAHSDQLAQPLAEQDQTVPQLEPDRSVDDVV